MTTTKEIIDRLANKELGFGCRVKHKYWTNEDMEEGERNRYGIITGKADNHHNGNDVYYIQWSYAGGYATPTPIYDFSEKHPDGIKILGHPVLIGDVLEKFGKLDRDDFFNENKLICFWSHLGITKSLQQIEEESGYEEVYCHCPKKDLNFLKCDSCIPIKSLKDPNARALFGFLGGII